MKTSVNKLSNDSYLIPPKHIAFPGGGGGEETFRRLGNRSFKFFLDYGKLKPDAKVLEVACGVGCMALPLTKYLSDKGEYYGFDLVKERIEWCQKAYKEKHPNFHFQVSDVYNKSYNTEE